MALITHPVGERVVVGSRMPVELARDLAREAARNERTISSEIRVAVREYLQKSQVPDAVRGP